MSTSIRLTTRLKDYGALMKPRITFLALITTFSGSCLAAGGLPEPRLLLVLLLGTALGASAANTLNNYVDRNLDQQMKRTRNRCLPDGRIAPGSALFLGILLGSLGVGLLSWQINLLSGSLLLFTIAFYIFVYTLWLKRSSPLSTEIGSIAGAMPPVVGWAAQTGSLGWEAGALFAIMFIWQPPHFWALAIYYRDDYKNAGLPRFPVVRSMTETKRRIMTYALLLLPASMTLYMLGTLGLWYAVPAFLLGTGYLSYTLYIVMRPINKSSAMQLFSASNIYLLVLFVFMLLSVLS